MNHRFGRFALRLFSALLIVAATGGSFVSSYAEVARSSASATVIAPASVADAGGSPFIAAAVGDLNIHVAGSPPDEPGDPSPVCGAPGAWRRAAAAGFVGLGPCRTRVGDVSVDSIIVSAIEISSPERGIMRVIVAFN